MFSCYFSLPPYAPLILSRTPHFNDMTPIEIPVNFLHSSISI